MPLMRLPSWRIWHWHQIVRVQAYSIDNLNQITYRFDAYTSACAKAPSR